MSGSALEEDVEELPADEDTGKFEFDQEFQKKLVALFLRDSSFALRAKDLLDPSYFTEDAHGQVIRIFRDFVSKYRTVPDPRLIKTILADEIAAKRLRDDMRKDVIEVVKGALGAKVDLSSSGYVLDKVGAFARQQAVQHAMMTSVDLLEKGDYAKIEQLMRGALAVGNISEFREYDYWKEIESRTQMREDWKAGKLVKTGISTGVSEFDAYLYHGGWGRSELSLLMGAAKAGKSLSLGEFTKNASLLGYNTFYGSCEVAARIIADRIDAALSDTAMRALKDDPKVVAAKIRAAEAKAGAFKLADFASGTLKPSQLHRIIEHYKSEGIVMDLITVDYADIMAAEYRSDNLIDNMRSIYIDLRAIAFEFNAALLTATQTNREGAKKSTAKMTDVAEDFNKIRTADVVLGINATEAEKSSNEARITWVASRNSEDGFSFRIRQDRAKLKFVTAVLGKE